MKSIRILGIGGQGIAFSGWLLGYAATLSGLYASVHHSYGAEVRGGTVTSNILIDEKPIENPYRDVFDVYLVLHSFGWKNVDTDQEALIIADEDIAMKNSPSDIEISWKPFDKIAHEKRLPINMIALGYLAKIGVIEYTSLKKAVETRGKNIKENIMALDIGYNL
jgi:Pyruvate/2-oxoacid:ferredoxin oxidoreductase gamma subunit